MNSPTHQEKRQIFERHLLFGKLSASEIELSDKLCPARTLSVRSRDLCQRVARAKLGGRIARKHQD